VSTPATFRVTGMSCAGCAARVERSVRVVPGILEASVNFAAGTLAIRARDGERPDVTAAVQAAGYDLLPVDGRPTVSDPEAVWLRVRLAVAVFFAMSAMLPSVVLYTDAAGAATRWWLAAASGALTVPVVFFSGWPFLARAVRSLRRLDPGMDLLVTTGALATFVYSAVALAAGSSAVYFETAGAIVTFLLVGRVLDDAARRRGLSAVTLLHALSPPVAHVLDVDGRGGDVGTGEVPRGARVLVRPGERVPLDGKVVAGTSHLDRSLITGESMPAAVGEGDLVEAGTLNQHGALVLEVTAAVGARALDRIAASVDRLLSRRAPLQALADRVAARLTVTVLAVAGLTGALFLATTGDAALALLRAVAVLVIACPCALGLATPMAVVVAAGRAASRGILFRDAAVIERAAAVTSVLLDKTGTLTMGRPAVVDVLPVAPYRREEVLALAAIAEAGSEHPIARAILSAAAPPREPGVTRVVPGGGVVRRGADGRELRAGTRAFLEAEGVRGITDPPAPATVVHVADGATWAGTILVADPLRDGAAGAVAALRALGLRVGLVTGDRAAVAEEVARAAGIDEVHAGRAPEEKARLVTAAQERGEVVAFAGDGLNDGPALAAADAGVAVEDATDVARAAAAVTLRSGGVERLAEALALARATRRTMRQNVAWAIGYNLVAIPAAIAGLVSPALAALAMAASSLSVIASSLRLAKAPRVLIRARRPAPPSPPSPPRRPPMTPWSRDANASRRS
jgi:heavy metal translocating P-type ATPase